jgi:fructose-1-phosphate kinase PfkB-like protein
MQGMSRSMQVYKGGVSMPRRNPTKTEFMRVWKDEGSPLRILGEHKEHVSMEPKQRKDYEIEMRAADMTEDEAQELLTTLLAWADQRNVMMSGSVAPADDQAPGVGNDGKTQG